jgi:hypothetical protein
MADERVRRGRETDTPSPSPLSTPQEELNRKMRTIILVVGTVIVLAMTYGSGMRSQVRKLKAQYEQVKVYKQETRLAQIAVRGRDAQLQQWEARRLLDLAQRAAASGDAAGARAHQDEAVARLETADKADAAITADLTDLIPQIKAAAPAALAPLVARMDDALGKVAPKPDALGAVTIPPPTQNDVPTGNDISRPIGGDADGAVPGAQ